jgi:hypothetical protein
MRGLIVAALLVTSGLSAADPDMTERPRRSLNGHLFIQSLMLADPFVSSSFAVQAGGGAAFTESGATLTAQGWTTALQVGILRCWALRVGGAAGVLSSAAGTITSWELMPGTTLSWQVAAWLRLAVVLDFDYRLTSSMRIPERTDTFALIPGLALAIAPLERLGITLNVQHLWERRDDHVQAVDNSRVVVATALDLDLRPVGLLVAWRGQFAVLRGEQSIHELEAGIYYNEREPLTIGLVARARWFDIFPGQQATSIVGTLLARYYWN